VAYLRVKNLAREKLCTVRVKNCTICPRLGLGLGLVKKKIKPGTVRVKNLA